MENRVNFEIKEENGKWFVLKTESVNGGTWSCPKIVSEALDTKEEAEEELEYQRWHYWFLKFREIIGETPTTLYDLNAEQLESLVLDLEKKFSAPIDIVWTMPSAFSDEGLYDVGRHPRFQCYIDIMKKHNAI